jgi:hypothetical protein
MAKVFINQRLTDKRALETTLQDPRDCGALSGRGLLQIVKERMQI